MSSAFTLARVGSVFCFGFFLVAATMIELIVEGRLMCWEEWDADQTDFPDDRGFRCLKNSSASIRVTCVICVLCFGFAVHQRKTVVPHVSPAPKPDMSK